MARKTANTNSGLADELANGNSGSDSDANGNDSVPSGDGDGSLGESSVINPGDIISGAPDTDTPSSEPRRRGRPKGSRNGKSAGRKSEKESTADLAALFVMIHFGLSKLTSVEEFQMDEDEAKKLAGAAERVARLYTDYVVPETAMAWIGLFVAIGSVYGPRFAAYKLRMQNEAEKKKRAQAAPAGNGPIIEGVIA